AKDGTKIPVEINARVCVLGDGTYIVASSRDVTERREAKEALKENETRLSLALDATSTGLWDWHVQTGELVVNEKWAELAGYTLKELEPVSIRTWMNLCHPEDLETSNGKLENYFAGRTDCYECEARIRHKNGSWRWIRDRGKVVEWDDSGKPLRMTGTHTDITRRKNYEEKLKNYAGQLNERNKELNCLYGISRLVEEPGNSLDDILQETINILASSLQYPEAACGRIKLGEKEFATGNFRETRWRLAENITAGGRPAGVIEVFYVEKKPASDHGPFLTEEKSLLHAVAERLGHIIERMRADEQLRRSEQKFRDIFNSTGDAVFIHDTEGNFLEVNYAASSKLGYTREELLRMTPVDIDTPYYAEAAPRRIRELKQKDSLVFESAHRTKNGEVIPVEINSRRIEYEGKPRILSIARDITERIEKQALEDRLKEAQRIESIGRLAGGVAHDLNNLLTPVLGYAELLIQDMGNDHPNAEPLNEILKAGKKARDLVAQLLAYGRRQMLEFERLDLNTLLKALNNLIRKTVRENIDVKMNLAPSLPEVKGDSRQLEQVIINLVINARDAMPEGGSLIIETSYAEFTDHHPAETEGPASGGYVMLSVKDTGHGMDSETLEKAFEPFFTTRDMDKGSGLGLSTSFGIIKQHGGHIRASSKPGQGSTLKIYLPVV
ncbi:MAG: PAS domain-containing sensor histidine kinase, partial [Desulfosalsimonas sp.]